MSHPIPTSNGLTPVWALRPGTLLVHDLNPYSLWFSIVLAVVYDMDGVHVTTIFGNNMKIMTQTYHSDRRITNRIVLP